MQLLICNPISADDEIDVQAEEKELAILSELYKTSCVSVSRGRILQEYFSMTKTLTTVVLAVLLGAGTFALTAGVIAQARSPSRIKLGGGLGGLRG
jgi:hypothetical protein